MDNAIDERIMEIVKWMMELMKWIRGFSEMVMELMKWIDRGWMPRRVELWIGYGDLVKWIMESMKFGEMDNVI